MISTALRGAAFGRRAASGLALGIALAASPAAAQENPTEAPYTYRAEVVEVIDGDTIDVHIDLGFYVWIRFQRIQLYEADAPEADAAGGAAAAAWLKERIGGKTVILKSIHGEDSPDRKGSFGNWFGIVYLDGVDINEELVAAGHATRP